MLRLIVRHIIGGRSGKREAAWAVLILWVAGFVWSAIKETSGAPVSGVQEILSAALIPVISLLALAHGMEWVSKQTKWGGLADDWRDYPSSD